MPTRCLFFLIPTVLSFLLGTFLVGSTVLTTAGLALWAVAVMGVFAYVAVCIRATRSEKKIKPRHIVGEVLGVIGGSLLPVWIGWTAYFHRPKPDTVGYAEFTGPVIRFDLPPGWRFSYNRRFAPSFNQGVVKNGAGRPRLEVYTGAVVRGPEPLDLDGYARQTIEAYKKAGLQLERVEYRQTPRGRCWVYWKTIPQGEPPFGTQPVLYVQYAEQWGYTVLLFDFHMPAEEAEELEPLSWQFVRTAEIRASEQAER